MFTLKHSVALTFLLMSSKRNQLQTNLIVIASQPAAGQDTVV